MKKLLLLILTLTILFAFTACQKEELPTYSLAFINSSDESILDYSKTLENYNTIDLSQENTSISSHLTSIEDLSLVEEIIVFDETIDDVFALELFEIIKPFDIPISFAFASLSDETLNSYDKAYNFALDYTYMGEILAQSVYTLWEDGTLDKNESLLLEFSSIGYSNQTENEKEIYSSFVKNIELLGIPYSILNEEYIDVYEQALLTLDETVISEIVVILDSKLLDEIYDGYEKEIPLISHSVSLENKFSDNANILFADYTQYFDTTLEIFENIENKTYPFSDISLPIIGKTIYLTPNK